MSSRLYRALTHPLAIVSTVGLAWWLCFHFITRMTLEDALITYRYATNLVLGNGYVFNSGEYVQGTTTPLQTLLLAGAGVIFGAAAIPSASSLLMGACGLATGVGNYFLLRRCGVSATASLLATLTFFASDQMTSAVLGGMETPLAIMLMCMSALALAGNRVTLAIVACALLVLARIDGLIWAGLVGVAILYKNRRIPYVGLAFGGALVGAWSLFAWNYFGTILPNTIAAKQIVGPDALWWQFPLWYLRSLSVAPGEPMFPFVLIAYVMGALAFWRKTEQRPLVAVLLVFPMAYGALFYFGRAPMFAWYLTPPLWTCLLLIAIGFESLATLIGSRVAQDSDSSLTRKWLLVTMIGAFIVLQNWSGLGRQKKYQENENGMRRVVGVWLRENTPPQATVAMEAIGYQGYYSDRRVIDMAGLVSPEVVALRRVSKSNAELFYQLQSQLKPDYLVLRSFEVDENRHFHGGAIFENDTQREYFQEHFSELQRFDAPHPELMGENGHLTVYGRRPESALGPL
jgi:arabinofuranosyltransferase